ncbi:hypothetical protein AVEN_255834-1 [Araneus ventricosus]|uniref:Uncharacterized protein n=1 Tax=Araneus ventricosus TaxID=182803 RepID=A0A4Y2ELN1_ARAVE|nr:hypothetical protein AVEN_255834-1 [Araneus ventricosus]
MKEETRLQLGDLSSLRTNHQEARQQPLPCLFKVRCLKERESRERGNRRKKVNRRSAASVVFVCESDVRISERRTDVFFTPYVAESISTGKCPFGGPIAFYRGFV